MIVMSASVTGLMAIVALLSGAAAAQSLPTGPELKAAGWKEIKVPGRRRNTFAAEPGNAIVIRSDRAVSFLYAPLPPSDASPAPVMSAPDARLGWRWRVDRDIAATDLSARGKDDRPVALHVWFPAPDARKSGGLGRLVMAGIMGVPDWGRAITYVWGGAQDAGTVLPNPYMDGREGVLIVLRKAGAPTGEWLSETVDIAADYRRAFGQEPPAPSFIAVSGDTDDTKQSSEARIADIHFRAPAP